MVLNIGLGVEVQVFVGIGRFMTAWFTLISIAVVLTWLALILRASRVTEPEQRATRDMLVLVFGCAVLTMWATYRVYNEIEISG